MIYSFLIDSLFFNKSNKNESNFFYINWSRTKPFYKKIRNFIFSIILIFIIFKTMYENFLSLVSYKYYNQVEKFLKVKLVHIKKLKNDYT
jgi:hypothetical protein